MRAVLRSGWLVVALVIAGAVIRVVRYAADRSLWGDEGALALNIVQRGPLDLLEPLDYRQGGPTGFLLTEKTVTYLLGERELALRLFPLLCGIAVLVLFALLARRLLQPEAAALAVALAAFSETLVYYSQEVKQYETDVLATVVVLYAAVRVDWRRVRLAAGVALALGGAVLVWFSHPVLIVLPSVLAVLLVSARLRHDRPAVRTLAFLGTAWLVSALGAFVVNRRNVEIVAEGALSSLSTTGGTALGGPFREAWDLYPSAVDIADSTTAVAVVLALAGLVALWRRNATHAAVLVAPGLATFAARVLEEYPLTDRFVLFLAPPLILLAAEGALAVAESLPRVLAPAGVLAAFLLLVFPLGQAVGNTANPPGHEEVKAVLEAMEREWRPGDSLYVWWQSQYPYRYYAECDNCGVLDGDGPASAVWPPEPSDLPGGNALATNEPELYLPERSHALESYVDGFGQLDAPARAWFLFSSTWADEFVRYALDCIGTRLDEARGTRAVAYLYDLSAPGTSTACRA
jgi:hypothetical protein